MGKAIIAFVVVVVIVGLIGVAFFGAYISTKNTLVSKNEGGEIRMVAGRHRAPEARGFDSEPR